MNYEASVVDLPPGVRCMLGFEVMHITWGVSNRGGNKATRCQVANLWICYTSSTSIISAVVSCLDQTQLGVLFTKLPSPRNHAVHESDNV